MKKTSVYLTNRAVFALVADVKRGGLTVLGCHRAELPGGLVCNSAVADGEALASRLAAFWQRHSLPKKRVSLVADSDAIKGRVLEVPALPPRRLRQLIANALTPGLPAADYVYDHAVLDRGTRRTGGRIYALAAERGQMAAFVRLFPGIELTGLDMTPMCAARYFEAAGRLQARSFIYTALCGPDCLSMLFSGGVYVFMDRVQLAEGRGTAASAVEITRAIRGMMQYHYGSQSEPPLSHAYLSGLEGEESGFLADMASALGLEVGPVPLPPGVSGLAGGVDGFVPCIGDLLG